MTRLVRGLFIVWVVLRYGLDELFLSSFEKPWLRLLGRIVSFGPTASVFSPPFHPYTELLLSSVPDMRPEWLDEVLAKREAGGKEAAAAARSMV